jgi:hypothetical protein
MLPAESSFRAESSFGAYAQAATKTAHPNHNPGEVILVDETLDRLAALDPQQAKIVESGGHARRSHDRLFHSQPAEDPQL